jgi:hypothetical protein
VQRKKNQFRNIFVFRWMKKKNYFPLFVAQTENIYQNINFVLGLIALESVRKWYKVHEKKFFFNSISGNNNNNEEEEEAKSSVHKQNKAFQH